MAKRCRVELFEQIRRARRDYPDVDLHLGNHRRQITLGRSNITTNRGLTNDSTMLTHQALPDPAGRVPLLNRRLPIL